MYRRLRAYVPYAISGIIALNGFLALATGLSRIFQFGRYLELGAEAMPRYLQVTPGLRPGGLVGVALGLLLIGLGKGLAERRRRSWRWAVGALAALLLHNALRGPTVQTTALSALLLVLLFIYRGEFSHRVEHRPWSFAELVAAASVVFALAFGIVGSFLLRREFSGITTWTDAVYFTVVTFSTLGYGDILPQTDNAKLFSICMVVIGLGSFVTALTVLIGPMIEQRIKGVFTAMSKFQRTVNHVVICGYTNVTESIVDELRERHVPFVIIEPRDDVYAMLQGTRVDALHGDPTERHTLEQANLPNAAAVIAATDSDATNTLIALTARDLRASGEMSQFRIIARAEDEENLDKLRRAGADEAVSPSTLGGRMMANQALRPEADPT